jgi:protease PrsW
MDLNLALAGSLPALFAMWYVDRVDGKRPEPRSMLRKVAVAGGLSTLPCIGIQLALGKLFPFTGLQAALFTSYIEAGMIEETAKATCLLLVVWRHPAFDERFDGIVYATRAGLGFALVENVGYLLGTQSLEGYAGVFIMRAVLAVPGHAIFAGMMGYFTARKRFDGAGPGMFGGLLIAILMHGTYNAALFSMPLVPKDMVVLVLPLMAIPVAIVAIGFLVLRGMAKRAIALDDIAHHREPAPIVQALPVGFTLR